MDGRYDIRMEPCGHCGAKGTDPKNRKRPCPICGGSKRWAVCTTCNVALPCPGTLENVMDQSYCSLRG